MNRRYLLEHLPAALAVAPATPKCADDNRSSGASRPLARSLLTRIVWFCTALAALAAVIGFGSVAAHSDPILDAKSKPGIGETVAVAPTALDLFFSQNLTTPLTVTLQQTTPKALDIPLGALTQGKTAKEWIVPISLALSPGAYHITLSGPLTTTSDFTVKGTPAATPGASAVTIPTVPKPTTPKITAPSIVTTVVTVPGTNTTTAGSAGSPGSTGSGTGSATKTDAVLTVAAGTPRSVQFVGFLGRWLTYLGLSALFGGLLLIVLAWHEGVDYVRTVRFFRLAWVGAVLGSVLTVIALTAVAKGTGIGSSLSPGSWTDLKGDGVGLAALARLLFVLASAWVAFGPERAVSPASQLPAFAFPFLSLVTFGFSRTAGTKLLAVGVVAGGLHVLAVAAWLGGLLLLARVALSAPGEEDAVRAVRGFSRIAVPALLVVVATGAVQVFRLVGGPTKLFGTGYGRLLLLKVFVVAFMAYVATANRHAVRQRLTRATQINERTAFRLGRSVGGEAMIGMVVLAFSGLMMNFVPAGLTASTTSDGGGAPITQSIAFRASGLDATVGIGPSAVGVANSLTFTVRQPTNVNLVDLTFTFYPAKGVGQPFQFFLQPKNFSHGQFRQDNVPFACSRTEPGCDPSGVWQIIVTGHTQNSEITAIVKTFPVKQSTATGAATTQPPNNASTGSTTATSS